MASQAVRTVPFRLWIEMSTRAQPITAEGPGAGVAQALNARIERQSRYLIQGPPSKSGAFRWAAATAVALAELRHNRTLV